MCQLWAFCLPQCEHRELFIRHIRGLSLDVQSELAVAIQEVLTAAGQSGDLTGSSSRPAEELKGRGNLQPAGGSRELTHSRQKQQLQKAFIEGEQARTGGRHTDRQTALQKQDLGSQKHPFSSGGLGS